MERLRVALVGCGIISGAHLAGFQHNRERAQIVACCDTSEERAARAASEAGMDVLPRVTTDYATILNDSTVDAVDLCLPHHLHADMTIAAAKAGKHILCEKPLALTLADCDRMDAAAKEAGVVLMHGENMRTAPVNERAAALIREGNLGTIIGIQSTYAHWQSEALNKDWRTRPEESGGGHLMDGGIHYIDVMRHLGGEVVAVHAMTTRYRPELGAQSEDTGIVNMRFEAGHLGQLFASHASRGRGASCMMTVFGTESCLSLEAFGGDRALIWFPRDRPSEVLVTRQTWQDTFVAEIKHFIEVILDGVPLRSTVADGKANIRLVQAAYESAQTGREVLI